MRKFYRKDAGQSLTIRYSLAGRVDYRTFHAFTTWSNLRNGDQFPVTIRFYEMQAEAEAVQRILQSVHNSNIANVLELDVDYQNGYTAIIFEKFKSSFNNWLNVGLNIWEYNSDGTLVISMTNEFLIPFKGIIDGIRALHYKGLYHGNLINGVTVSSSGTIKLVNFNHEQDDFEQGMKKDLDDLKVLVWQVVEKYPTQDGSEDTPVVLSLFFQLEYECRDLRIDGGLRTYAYFMYHNPLFYDGNDRYNMTQKLWDYSLINRRHFCSAMELVDDATYLINWWKRVPAASIFYEFIKIHKKTGDRYNSPIGVLSFFRDAYPHFRENVGIDQSTIERELNQLFPDVIPKLYFEFVRKIGCHNPTMYGYEAVPFFQTGSPFFP